MTSHPSYRSAARLRVVLHSFVAFVIASCVGGVVACSGGAIALLASDGGAGDGGASSDGAPSDGGASSDGAASDGAAEGDSSVPASDGSCLASYPVSQPHSAPCCPGYGASACGAGLFCAAFDGGTQPSCYAEHSRADGKSCTADVQCSVTSACDSSGVCQRKADAGCTGSGCKCPSTCATNAECQATCATSGTVLACCDAVTSACYATMAATCL